MMNHKRLLAAAGLTLATILAATGASAQTNFAGGLYFNAGFPQGDFNDQIDRNAYGLGGQFFYTPEKSPFGIGLELGWMNYGRETRREPFSTTIPDVTVEVSTTNNIVQGFLVFRGHLPRGPIRPYADALVGFNYLFTETSISDADEPGEDVASSTNQDDAVFAYGFGGGVTVPVYHRTAEKGGPLQILIDAGLRYVIGGEAEYLEEGSIRREGGQVSFDVIQSKTDMLRLHVGVMVRF
ncbi:hypothetical protein GF377_08555 [candidate division GN15 bacterium]|nr:hypothetical protein [candidate division GN15 bacterium]